MPVSERRIVVFEARVIINNLNQTLFYLLVIYGNQILAVLSAPELNNKGK